MQSLKRWKFSVTQIKVNYVAVFPYLFPCKIRCLWRCLLGTGQFLALPDSSTLIFLVGLSQFSSSDISISSSRRMPMSCSLWAFRSSWKHRTHGHQKHARPSSCRLPMASGPLWLTRQHLELRASTRDHLPRSRIMVWGEWVLGEILAHQGLWMLFGKLVTFTAVSVSWFIKKGIIMSASRGAVGEVREK